MKSQIFVSYFFLAFCLQSAFASNINSSIPIAPGRGKASGVMGIIMVPAEPLAKTLPKGLTLSPELIQANHTYPAVMFIGQHEDLSVKVKGKWVRIEKHYHEATLTFTVVGPYEQTKRYTYTSRIIVDSTPAMLMGWALGYPKRLAKIQFTEETFEGEFCSDRPIMNVEFKEVTSYDEEAFKRNLQLLQSSMNPTIGKTAFGWLCYDFEWDFANASIKPVTAQIEFFEAFAGKDLVGKYDAPSMDQTPLGSIYIESGWKMFNYRRCQ